MQRLYPDKLGMLYHAPLFDRMVVFAKERTPEFPAEIVVNKWLERFYSGDPLIHIIVDLDEKGLLIGHAILEILEMYGTRALTCYQVQSDFRHKTGFDAEAFEYIDKLMQETNCQCMLVVIEKNAQMYKKKYGFQKSREVLIKWSNKDGVTGG